MSALVSAIVVNWNGGAFITRCLDSLVAQAYPNLEIIVVDNASTDGSRELIAQRYPQAHLVVMERNCGFAGGCNAGIEVARGTYIATLNSDARADPLWIAELVAVIDGRPDVGMVSSKMLFELRPDLVNSTGICLDRVGIAWDRRGGEADEGEAHPIDVFGPCAGAALYRKALFDDIGAFDADFFMYLDDVDLAWRARLAGWRAIYAPAARVFHWHSRSSGENSPFKRFHLSRNKVWLIAKNYPAPEVWLYLPAIIAYDLAGLITRVLLRPAEVSSVTSFASVIGRLVGLQSLRPILAKRRIVQRQRRVPRWVILSYMERPATPRRLLFRQAHLSNLTTLSKPDE